MSHCLQMYNIVFGLPNTCNKKKLETRKNNMDFIIKSTDFAVCYNVSLTFVWDMQDLQTPQVELLSDWNPSSHCNVKNWGNLEKSCLKIYIHIFKIRGSLNWDGRRIRRKWKGVLLMIAFKSPFLIFSNTFHHSIQIYICLSCFVNIFILMLQNSFFTFWKLLWQF